MKLRGYERINTLGTWKKVMSQGYVQRTLIWDDADPDLSQLASQLMERRLQRPVPDEVRVRPKLDSEVAVEWGAVVCRASVRRGGAAISKRRRHAPRRSSGR